MTLENSQHKEVYDNFITELTKEILNDEEGVYERGREVHETITSRQVRALVGLFVRKGIINETNTG